MPIIFEFYEYSNENNFEDLSLCSLRYLEISHRAYSKDWKYFVPREYNYSPIVNLELVLYLCWSDARIITTIVYRLLSVASLMRRKFRRSYLLLADTKGFPLTHIRQRFCARNAGHTRFFYKQERDNRWVKCITMTLFSLSQLLKSSL